MNHLSWRLLSCLDCRLYRARLPRCSSKNFTMTFQACWLSGTPGSTKGCAKAQWAAPSQTCSRSEEHTSELQSLMRISYAVFCLKKKQTKTSHTEPVQQQ